MASTSTILPLAWRVSTAGHRSPLFLTDFISTSKLFRRCVVCPNVTPSCPTCPKGQTCSLSIQTCNDCPSTSCIPGGDDASSSNGGAAASKSHGNAGAIAGGVIGGVFVIALATYLVYRFCIKNRRHEVEADEWTEEQEQAEKVEQFASRRDDRASMHTVASLASTVLTRASNVIQIAYIPGVTNRSPPSTPGLLVPPVPPLPFSSSSSSTSSTPSHHQDQHFFMPDLRESTYSGNDRHSLARDSVTPSLGRNSLATSIYRNNVVVDTPAQTGIRGKAAVVRVKSSNSNSPTGSRASTPPPMPAINHDRYGQARPLDGAKSGPRAPPSPAFSVGSTFLNGTANTAKAVTARPVMVHKGSKGNLSGNDDAPAAASAYRDVLPHMSIATTHSGGSRSSARMRRDEKSLSVFEDVSSEDDKTRKPRRSWRRGRSRDSAVADSPASHQSPFSDAMAPAHSPGLSGRSPARGGPPTYDNRSLAPGSPSSGKSTSFGHQHSGSLSKVIEEATRRASARPMHGGLGGVNREPSPFSDANEVK